MLVSRRGYEEAESRKRALGKIGFFKFFFQIQEKDLHEREYYFERYWMNREEKTKCPDNRYLFREDELFSQSVSFE